MGNWLTGLLDRIFAVVSALCFAQLPIFMQQYQQQLYGHIAELKIQVDAMQQAAAAGNKTLPEYINHFVISSDPDFSRQGALMHTMVDRTFSLTEASQSLSAATVFEKPFVFFNYVNWNIAKSTFANFQAGLPFTFEGLVYGVSGIIIGYVFFFLLRRFVSWIFRALFKKKKVVKPVLSEVPIMRESNSLPAVRENNSL